MRAARFAALVTRAALLPIRFHDLRHGAATMLLAAAAAVAIAAFVPSRNKIVP